MAGTASELRTLGDSPVVWAVEARCPNRADLSAVSNVRADGEWNLTARSKVSVG